MPQPTNQEKSNGASRREPSGGRALIAIDLGAESCRTSLLRWVDGAPQIQVVDRFPNGAIRSAGGLRWDIGKILAGVEQGLRRCTELAPEGIAAIGVDGWAVDYVRLGEDGGPVSDPFCYRDERNVEAQREVHARISADRLYELTGVQILRFNTLYQLFADSASSIPQNAPWTNLPEFVLSYLGGTRVSEYTNATHTQLLSATERLWCPEIFEKSGLDLKVAPPVVPPGTEIGKVRAPLASLLELRDARLIVPACHDTASAIAGIPAHGEDWAFISSGTWSLVGTVLNTPRISQAARLKNFSNQGGVGGKIYFLKNVSGMWMLQQCLEQWKLEGRAWTIEELIASCAAMPAPDDLLDVDDPNLVLPGDMPERINAQLTRAGKNPIPTSPSGAPAMANLIFHSLARRYADVLEDVAVITGKQFQRLYIVGGGSRNRLLNRLTAEATGLSVVPGSTESATAGNFAIQLAALSGSFEKDMGVSSAAVAGWAERLSDAFTANADEPRQARTQ